jgi:glutamyl/glutaminyl-tRNA synthetase
MQHIGGVRTALFNYLYARSKDGHFILRLEDTDQVRSSNEFVSNLYDTLAWLGINGTKVETKGASLLLMYNLSGLSYTVNTHSNLLNEASPTIASVTWSGWKG